MADRDNTSTGPRADDRPHGGLPTGPGTQYPPQFHAGELQDLLDAVDNHLMSYKHKDNPKTVRQRARMQGLKTKLGGMS